MADDKINQTKNLNKSCNNALRVISPDGIGSSFDGEHIFKLSSDSENIFKLSVIRDKAGLANINANFNTNACANTNYTRVMTTS